MDEKTRVTSKEWVVIVVFFLLIFSLILIACLSSAPIDQEVQDYLQKY